MHIRGSTWMRDRCKCCNPMNTTGLKILVIEDDDGDQFFIREHEEHTYKFAETYALALEYLQRDVYDLIITDVSLPDNCGLEKIAELNIYAPVIVMSSVGNGKMTEAVKRHGAVGFLNKKNLDNLTDFIAGVGVEKR